MPHEDGTVTAASYDNEAAKQFCDDAEAYGLEIEHYHGRFNWEGPAVRVDGFGSFKSAVPMQHDNMGLGYIVYPVEPAPLAETVE